MIDFIHFGISDIIDILLLTVILYQMYRLLKGTAAVRLLWTIIILCLLWKLFGALHLNMMSALLGQFISVGVLAVIVVFQPEIRKFMLLLGNTHYIQWFSGRFRKQETSLLTTEEINTLIRACRRMSNSKTGALIVIERDTPLDEIIDTGDKLDALISRELIENIFFKNSPLHDGALIIKKHRIIAARCILPVSNREDISPDLGLRHRSAIGVTTLTDALAIVVSEQTGNLSLCRKADIIHDISPLVLEKTLNDILIKQNTEKNNDAIPSFQDV